MTNCCPACGEPAIFCPGHDSDIDPVGSRLVAQHEASDHGGCHPDGCDYLTVAVTVKRVDRPMGASFAFAYGETDDRSKVVFVVDSPAMHSIAEVLRLTTVPLTVRVAAWQIVG